MPDKSKLVAGFFVGESPKGSGSRVTLKRLPDGGIEMPPEQLEQLLKDAGKVTEIRALLGTFPRRDDVVRVSKILEILEAP
jgi:hypothetical protein